MDLQKMVDAFGEASKVERANYHLTLGGLIRMLESIPSETLVIFDDEIGTSPDGFGSYRGYYSDLYLDAMNRPKKAYELLIQANEVLDKTFVGYKGGDFIMDENTPLWRAEYGDCGPAIIAAKVINGNVVLITKEIK